MEMPASGVVVKTYGRLDVMEYTPGTNYTVKLAPHFALYERGNEETAIANGVKREFLSPPASSCAPPKWQKKYKLL